MKGKLLLGLVLVTITTSSFALEIDKGRVINHKEWTTGNAKGFFKPGKMTNEMMKGQGWHGNSSYSSLYSYASSTQGTVNTPVNIEGDNYIYAHNDTEKDEIYHYTFSICAHNSDHTAQCAYYYDELVLQPGGSASSSEIPSLQVTFTKPGKYRSDVSSYLYKEQDGLYVHNGSTADGSVEIS